MAPKLSELLGLRNPWAWQANSPGVYSCYKAYNRALEDVWEKMEKYEAPGGTYLQLYRSDYGAWMSEGQHDLPGYWAWIPAQAVESNEAAEIVDTTWVKWPDVENNEAAFTPSGERGVHISMETNMFRTGSFVTATATPTMEWNFNVAWPPPPHPQQWAIEGW